MAIIDFARDDPRMITANFGLAEFQCPPTCGCNAQLIDDDLIKRLQTIRDKLGGKIKITSGYRCIKHNKHVDGGKASKHLYGVAADWRMQDRSINPVALGIVATRYFGAVGIYWYGDSAFVHTDTRKGKATWLCTAKGKYVYTSYRSFILPTIKKGCTGDVNKSATQMLQRLLGIPVDGNFGIGTENALRKAQAAHGLTVDGICGPASWKAISGAGKYL